MEKKSSCSYSLITWQPFLRKDTSLRNFWNLVNDFRGCSGLKINFNKSEIMKKIKKTIKILYLTYNCHLKQKLNFDEIINSIKAKLKMWKWRDLTIIGRIQIVKTFIVPAFLYRASLTYLNKEIIDTVNKIIFDFMWKGKPKVKRLALIRNYEDGGLKAPHLESIFKTQTTLRCKMFANDKPSSWKTILSYYLISVSGKFILSCVFDKKKYQLNYPSFMKRA